VRQIRGGVVLRRRVAVLVVTAGLTVGGCASNPARAPAAVSTAPTTSPAQPQTAVALTWARSFCQALHPVFDQLGAPPRPDLNNLDATRQALVNYLADTRNVTQQAIDRLSSIGPPPVVNGPLILLQIRGQLIALRDNLNDAVTQLGRADPNDSGAIGMAFGAAASVVGLLGTLTTDAQLRAAINQAPECQSLSPSPPPR
jgi:hypothetical protein